jgi:cytoskeletal protein CcmA (bactofilin family)
MERYPEEQYVNSLIGFGSRFKGDIEIDGLFRIDGDFSGSIKTEGKVLVGTHGRADCTVNARVVVIGGVFRGTIYAQEKILILSSAVVIGNLYTPRLIAEEGVLLHCSLVITGRREKSRGTVQSRRIRQLESGSSEGEGFDEGSRRLTGKRERSRSNRGLFGRISRAEQPRSSGGEKAGGHGEN